MYAYMCVFSFHFFVVILFSASRAFLVNFVIKSNNNNNNYSEKENKNTVHLLRLLIVSVRGIRVRCREREKNY